MWKLAGLSLIEMLVSLALLALIMVLGINLNLTLQTHLLKLLRTHQRLNIEVLLQTTLSQAIDKISPMHVAFHNATTIDFNPGMNFTIFEKNGAQVLRLQSVDLSQEFHAVMPAQDTVLVSALFKPHAKYYLIYDMHKAELVQLTNVTSVGSQKKILLFHNLYFHFSSGYIAPIYSEAFFIKKDKYHTSTLFRSTFGKHSVAIVSQVQANKAWVLEGPKKFVFTFNVFEQPFEMTVPKHA